jgi:glycosyltransferase involved in cell wall biosynthesis
MRLEANGRRPRVALVAQAVAERYAVPRVLAEQIKRLHEEIDFVVVSGYLDPAVRPFVREWRRVPMALPRSARFRQASLFVWVPWLLRGVDVDLVHTTMALVPSRVDLASIQWCYDAVGEAVPGTPLASRSAAVVERWCFTRRTRALAAVSERSRADFERRFGGIRVELTPNGVDHDRFAPNAEVRAAVREREGVGPDEVVVLFVGGSWRRKGLLELAEGFVQARSRTPARLWILGRGDPTLLPADERIRVFGYQEDVVPFYQAADVFALPSRYEEFALVSLEAAASGLPLVLTPINGSDELVGDGHAGVAVDPQPASIAAALTRLIDDPELRGRLGAAARERALGYTWDRSAAALLDVYRSLL